MKLNKFILATSIALVGISAAKADMTINMTGATSISQSVHQGIMNALGDLTYAYDATGGATNLTTKSAMFKGTVAGISGTVTIRTSFTGSVDGIRDLAQNNQLSYIDLGVSCTSAGNTSGITKSIVTGNEPNVAFSDVYQNTTKYTSPSLTNKNVAVVPFVFWTNASAPAELNNITPQLYKAIQTLPVPISMFTGSTTDARFVYPVGRDGGSGTRMTALAETGWGAKNPVNQYLPTVVGTAITDLVLTPQVSVPTDPTYIAEGNNGGSAANLITYLNATSNTAVSDGNVPVVVAYLGLADGRKVTSGKQLNYNGVPFSTSAVKNGQYTFWTYEHLFTRSGYYAGNAKTVLDKVITAFQQPAVLGIADAINEADMAVERTTDGALVTPK
ncbi:MAG: hypothetical protein PHQ12_01830 [Chthoniobacteraceae bacterium]|nr:hypothetical protein [Chthoniobacteraceae bacterium]